FTAGPPGRGNAEYDVRRVQVEATLTQGYAAPVSRIHNQPAVLDAPAQDLCVVGRTGSTHHHQDVSITTPSAVHQMLAPHNALVDPRRFGRSPACGLFFWRTRLLGAARIEQNQPSAHFGLRFLGFSR